MVLLELLDVCIFLHCLSAAEGSPSHWDMGKFLLRKEKSESGMVEALALVRQKIVESLFTYAEAVKQQIIHAKH